MDSNRRPPKFTCYFCNKTIDNETEVGHTAVCGSVLVPCPNKCGAYVPRMDFNKHKRECINRTTKSMPRLSPLNEESGFRINVPKNTSSLERQTNGHPQKSPTPRINEEIYRLSRKVAELEKYLQNQARSQTQFSAQNYGDLKNNQVQQNMEIEKMKYQQKISMDWKKNIETQIHNVRQSLSMFQNSKKENDIHWMTIQDKLVVLDKVQMELNYLKDTIFKEQNYTRQADANLQQDIIGVKDLLSQEHGSAAAIFNDHQMALTGLRRDMEDLKKTYEEQKNKFTNVVFDLRAASQIASEAAEKIEILERDFSEVRREINQIKLDMEILEGLSSSESNIYGRLIWKVTEVEAKMQRAKDFDSVVKSPVFYTHEYGYKIRILMYLNGLRKWKDRYALLCIHVLKGEYDMLLKWPCHIEGNIILRDLENIEKTRSFSKFITAKRQQGDEDNEEPQESSSTYIFIPHSTLLKSNFVKDDTLFIEVKITQNTKLETSL